MTYGSRNFSPLPSLFISSNFLTTNFIILCFLSLDFSSAPTSLFPAKFKTREEQMILEFVTTAVEVHFVWHDIWVATEWGRGPTDDSCSFFFNSVSLCKCHRLLGGKTYIAMVELPQELFREQAKPRWTYQRTTKLCCTILMYTILHISCWQGGKSNAHNSNKCIPYRELQKILHKK